MNKVIAELFEKTKDAIFVDKYLSGYIADTPVMSIVLEGKQAQLLIAAEELRKKAENA